MDKELGKDYKNLVQREQFLKDNADGVQNKTYMKQYTPEELQGHKEALANVSIEIAEIEEELKGIKADFAERLKPLKEQRNKMIDNIKQKAELVSEICYRFTDQEKRMTGFYNREGDLIEARPATADEMQRTIFDQMRVVQKTGTDN